MPAIRRRYHYANIILSIPSNVSTETALCGNTVDVYHPTGEIDRMVFDGLIDVNNINVLQQEDFCLIHNITGLHLGEAPYIGDWVEYNHLQLVLGLKTEIGVVLPILNERLFICGVEKSNIELKRKNNVSFISLRKQTRHTT